MMSKLLLNILPSLHLTRNVCEQAGVEFLVKSALKSTPKVLLNGVPLDDNGLTADKIEETIITAIMKATPKLQRAILAGELTDADNVGEWIMQVQLK